MKNCELCDCAANMYCESDQASLCWNCDAKVHSANFLVERHPRLLLCRNCQEPTTWRATGPRLSPIVSSCDRCCMLFHKDFSTAEEQDENNVSVDNGDSDDDEQEDCQVVPWRPTSHPPPPASSSSGDESSSLPSKARSSNSLKRIRHEKDIGSKEQRRRRRNDLLFGAPFSSGIDALFYEDSGTSFYCR
uniref:CONSTANS-like 1 n=1 Tax=Erycina pusilla TaxID=154679 RepID=M9QS80_9ASPA|nr:CONSTANS-like 1 [Erycina pusilla]